MQELKVNKASTEPDSSLLPAEVWYKSEGQRAAFFALVTSLISLGAQLFDMSLDIQALNLKVGILAQITNLGFTGWNMIIRKSSKIAPLTLSKDAAILRNETSPPKLTEDPTKKETVK